MLDDQPVPWKWRQLKQLTDKAKEDQGQRQAKRKKQRSTRNRLLGFLIMIIRERKFLKIIEKLDFG